MGYAYAAKNYTDAVDETPTVELPEEWPDSWPLPDQPPSDDTPPLPPGWPRDQDDAMDEHTEDSSDEVTLAVTVQDAYTGAPVRVNADVLVNGIQPTLGDTLRGQFLTVTATVGGESRKVADHKTDPDHDNMVSKLTFIMGETCSFLGLIDHWIMVESTDLDMEKEVKVTVSIISLSPALTGIGQATLSLDWILSASTLEPAIPNNDVFTLTMLNDGSSEFEGDGAELVVTNGAGDAVALTLADDSAVDITAEWSDNKWEKKVKFTGQAAGDVITIKLMVYDFEEASTTIEVFSTATLVAAIQERQQAVNDSPLAEATMTLSELASVVNGIAPTYMDGVYRGGVIGASEWASPPTMLDGTYADSVTTEVELFGLVLDMLTTKVSAVAGGGDYYSGASTDEDDDPSYSTQRNEAINDYSLVGSNAAMVRAATGVQEDYEEPVAKVQLQNTTFGAGSTLWTGVPKDAYLIAKSVASTQVIATFQTDPQHRVFDDQGHAIPYEGFYGLMYFDSSNSGSALDSGELINNERPVSWPSYSADGITKGFELEDEFWLLTWEFVYRDS